MFEEFSKRRLAGAQRCLVYDNVNPDGCAFDYQNPVEDADHFCVADRTRTTQTILRIQPNQIQISIPTLGLRPYLIPTLANIMETMYNDFSEVSGSELPSIAVVSNGNSERSALGHFVKNFVMAGDCGVRVSLVCTDVPGKSNAVNILHQHAVRNSSKMIIFVDDDLRLLPQNLSRIYDELADGAPRFIGIMSTPDTNEVREPVERDITNMIIAKRRAMGWPAPIGRINAMPTSIFPTITRFDVYDDVFLSAFFMINGIPQYVLDGVQALYKPSSSLFEFIKRKRRIKRSDEAIVKFLPDQFQKQFLDYAIQPKISETLSEEDNSWVKLSDLLLSLAETRSIFADEQPNLDETDLSSKSGHQMRPTSDNEAILRSELDRLKRGLGLM